jgi:hypothetical protein
MVPVVIRTPFACTYLRLRSILRPRHFIYDPALIATAPMGEILRSWRAFANHPALSPTRTVAPYPRLFVVQQQFFPFFA